ncbi:MAG: hypothetical protein KAW90_05695 [Dehalococcoidales bacterium]|nr:hypothetical protein [Dehalococcoidales bacterium]
MKGFKLSKTSWLILSAGIFIVILAGLGVTRSQQLKEQTQLDEELSLSTMRVNSIGAADLRPQLEELQQRLEESEAQLIEVKDRLRQTVVSADVTDKFFVIAEYCGVEIMNLGTTQISTHEVEGVSCSTTSITTTVEGEVSGIIDFIISLNDGFTTGNVQSAHISIPEDSTESEPSASIQMVVYSYEGN